MSDSILDKVAPTSNGQAEPPAAAPDPFDVSRLRLSQDFAATRPKKALVDLTVCKPRAQWFVRVRPEESYRLETVVFESDDDRETYLVDPSIAGELLGMAGFGPRAIFTAITRQGTPFLWPIKMADPDGRPNRWNDSAIEAAKRAMHTWLRLQANMQGGCYDVYEATGDLPEPVWPELPFQQMIRLAFRSRFINSPDHPALRRLRGDS